MATLAVSVDDLRTMVRIRLLEERLLELFAEGKVRGTTHTCIGQEAVAVGVGGALDPERDTVVSNHRGHGHYLATTGDVEGFLAEVMGKSGAVGHGVGGSQHLCRDGFFSNGILGGAPAVATGLAFAHKLTGEGGVSVAFMGDGTFGEGVVYEVLNMAALWRLPILYVVEDNGIAQSTPAHLNRAGTLSDRFACFGIEAAEVDGQDLQVVRAAATERLVALRNGKGPQALICVTARFAPHSKGDDTRPAEEIAAARRRDPLAIASAGDAQLKTLRTEVRAELDQVLERVERASPVGAPPAPERDTRATALGLEPGFDGTVVERIQETLRDLLLGDAETVLLGEDIADPYGGAFKATRGLSSAVPARVFTSPVSEAGLVALANGLALAGKRPIVEVMFGDFLFLAADQLMNHAAKFTHMYGERRPLPLVVRTPMGGRRGYGPTHSQSIEKFFLGNEALTVVALNHVVDPGDLLQWAVADDGPVLVIENKLLYGRRAAERPAASTVVAGAQGPRLVEACHSPASPDVVLVGYGGMAPILLEAAEVLAGDDVRATVMLAELVSPIDAALVHRLAELDRAVLIAEESTTSFGWGAELAARLAAQRPGSRIARLGARAGCIPATPHLEDGVLPQVDDVIEGAVTLLEQQLRAQLDRT